MDVTSKLCVGMDFAFPVPNLMFLKLRVFPVTRTQHTGVETAFMGVLKSVEEEPYVARCWVMPGPCTTLCVTSGFTEMLGYAPSSVVGKGLHTFCTTPDILQVSNNYQLVKYWPEYLQICVQIFGHDPFKQKKL